MIKVMDEYDFDKKLEKLAEILSELGDIRKEMDFLSSRLYDSIYDLENMRSDLEAFGDELDEDKKNE